MDISYRMSLVLLVKMLPGCLIRAQFLGAGAWQELLSVPEPGWLLFGLGWMGHTSPSPTLQLWTSLVETVLLSYRRQGGLERDHYAYQDPLKAGVPPQSRHLADPHCSTAAHREERQSGTWESSQGRRGGSHFLWWKLL